MHQVFRGIAAAASLKPALFARLRDRYRLIAPDHLGYGRTAAYAGGMPLIEHELAFIDALLNIGNDPVHLVGHSYGGALMAHTAVRAPGRVRSLTLIEPTLFHVLACTQRTVGHQEIWEQAQRVIRHVTTGNPEEAARGFIDYWVAPGAYDAMDERVRASVTAGMSKVHDEWLTAFEAQGATLEALAALSMPIQLCRRQPHDARGTGRGGGPARHLACGRVRRDRRCRPHVAAHPHGARE